MNYIIVWTIFDHPSDFPNSYVARCFHVGNDGYFATDEVVIGPTLELVRLGIPQGLFRIPVQPGEEPHIIESWI